MKSSDSVNSLTGLQEGKEKECFICLEDDQGGHNALVSSTMLRNCGCRFFVHPPCWNEWMKDKTDFDCPICHKESVKLNVRPNPVLEFQAHTEESRRSSIFLCIGIILAVAAAGIIISAIILW